MQINILEHESGEGMLQPVTIDRETISRTCRSVIKTMQNELPEETHSMDMFDCVLKESAKMLHSLPIKL